MDRAVLTMAMAAMSDPKANAADVARHDQRRLGMACRDLVVDTILIVGTLGRKGGDWACYLVEHKG